MSKKSLSLSISGGGPPRNPKLEVVGRDSFVRTLGEQLSSGSVEMYAPRRLGKSWVLRLLEKEGPPWVKIIYMDLEGTRDFYELVEKIGAKTGLLGIRLKAALGKALAYTFKGLGKAKDYDFPWKEHLEKMFKKLNGNEKQVWLLLDEFPIMVSNFKLKFGPEAATQLLDFFRFIRQNYPNIKFVLTGSIGLHWIIDELESASWRNPSNDLVRLTLRPLAITDAIILAEALFRGKKLDIGPAKELAEVLSGHPFYIQKAIRYWGEKKTDEPVSSFCDRIAKDPEDPFELGDLLKRIGHYFGRDAKIAMQIMDILAREQSVMAKDIASELDLDGDVVLNLLGKIEKDGYIQKMEGRYQMVFPIFKRWWLDKREGLL